MLLETKQNCMHFEEAFLKAQRQYAIYCDYCQKVKQFL